MAKTTFARISFLFGGVLLIYLVLQVGWRTLLDDFRRLGWFFLLILALSAIKYLIRSVTWAAAFFPEERQSWPKLFGYRLAGEALNYLSVAGPVLGEPVKASMLQGVRFAPALASTLLETGLNGIAAILVTVAGLAWLVVGTSSPTPFRNAGPAAILILLALGAGFLYALKRRLPVLTWPWQRLRGLRWLSSPKLGQDLALVERRMHRLSAERPGALWVMLLLGFVTQALALLEVYVVILPLGIVPRFSSVLIMEAFTKLAKAVFFFVPGRIGADEGSSAGIFAMLGLSPAAGVTLALARRLRALFWSALGLLFLLVHNVQVGREQPARGFPPSVPSGAAALSRHLTA